jgi:DNA primase
LVIYPPGKGWYCFGCHRGGDAVSFCVEFFHCGAAEALRVVEQLVDTCPEIWGGA